MIESFIQNGYLEIDLTRLHIHSDIYDKILNFDMNWKNNDLIERLPEIESEIWGHPDVVKCLELVLGKNYIRHPHAEVFDGSFHQNEIPHRDWPLYLTMQLSKQTYGDVWKPYYFHTWTRRARCRYVQVFYSPYLPNSKYSGTGFFPGSQYYNETFRWADLPVEPYRVRSHGKVVITHGDMYHRAYLNPGHDNRFVIKGIFLRTEEPENMEMGSNFLWNENIHDKMIYDFHSNWYSNHNLELNFQFDDLIDDFIKYSSVREFGSNRDKVKSLYMMGGVRDWERCFDLIDYYDREKTLLTIHLLKSLGLNSNVDEDYIIKRIDGEENSIATSSYYDILSSKGIGSERLQSKWMDWLKTTKTGVPLTNLFYGSTIVCQGNKDLFQYLIDTFNLGISMPRSNLATQELMLSIIKMSRQFNDIPDISQGLYELLEGKLYKEYLRVSGKWNINYSFMKVFAIFLQKNVV